MDEGTSRTFILAARDDRGGEFAFQPGEVDWRSTDPAVVSVAPGGGITGTGGGTAWVVATLGDLADSVAVTVTARPASVEIRGGPVSLTTGDTVRLGAAVLDRRGTPLAEPVFWRSSDSSVLLVNRTTGGIRAAGPGTALVTAESGGLSDAVSVTVAAPQPVRPTEADARAAAQRCVAVLRSRAADRIRELMGPQDQDGARPHARLLALVRESSRNLQVGDVTDVTIVGPRGEGTLIGFPVELRWVTPFGPRRSRTVTFEGLLASVGTGWRLATCRLAEGTELQ